MTQPIHILNEMGVLVSFSVAKRVTEDDIKKFFSRQKKVVKEEEKIGAMLREKIVSEIQDAIEKNLVPGLISPQQVAESMGVDKKIVANIPEMNRLILIISHKLAEKNYDKMSLCYFINSLVNMLNLSEEDFVKFHRQNNTEKEDDNDGDIDEDGDGNDSGEEGEGAGEF